MPLGDLHPVQEQGWERLSLLPNVFNRNLPIVMQKVLRDIPEFVK